MCAPVLRTLQARLLSYRMRSVVLVLHVSTVYCLFIYERQSKTVWTAAALTKLDQFGDDRTALHTLQLRETDKYGLKKLVCSEESRCVFILTRLTLLCTTCSTSSTG